MLEMKLLGAYIQENGETKVPFVSLSFAARLRDEAGKKENITGSMATNYPLISGSADPSIRETVSGILKRLRAGEPEETDMETLKSLYETEITVCEAHMGCWFVAENLEWAAQQETVNPDGYGDIIRDKRSKRGDRVGNFERLSLTQPVSLTYAGEGGGITVDMTGSPCLLA